MLTRTLTSASLAASLAACALPTAAERPPEIRVLRAEYGVGDTLRAQLVNESRERVIYGACSLALEREVSGQWTIVLPEPELCIAIGYSVEPGGRAPLKLTLPPTLVPGNYRVRQRILLQRGLPEELIYSAPIIIRAQA